ncbi:calcium-binding mitochondrial carrier protein SCaMC-2-A-like isoform X4 [Macrosteles quadrilineatus]|uniref:calcium-binding mitochondrial carrier protein SCaMC-2-A-like isoform X4 n=1 Tax=Macrosteles quadrilineatus TaxID=74068 RepID=UPI0023E19A0D|nr:calcium-binding mitochondrial carrier protein SCaMC-2-A-like isoform X4 [Macrosteles quadrilineatus]
MELCSYACLKEMYDKVHEKLEDVEEEVYLDIGEDLNVPDDFTQKEMSTGMWWRHLVAGGVAGAVSRTCTAPLDRAKVYLQVHGTRKTCIRTCIKNMIMEGGPWSMWRGNGINVLKIAPESALKFMAYEQVKKFIRNNSNNKELTIHQRFMAGSVAGGFSQTVIYPLEVLKTRLALRKTGEYKSIMDAAKKIFKHEGLKSFYRGYIPNMFGIIPYAGIDLACYETLKNNYLKKHLDETPSPLLLLACGTCSSTCGQVCSYPLALIRTRMQATPNNKHTMVTQFKEIVHSEGLVGLYRGITLNLLKVAPAVSISYIVYEHCRQTLGVNMT